VQVAHKLNQVIEWPDVFDQPGEEDLEDQWEDEGCGEDFGRNLCHLFSL